MTIEVMTADETILGGGRFGTDAAGFAALERYVSQFPDRIPWFSPAEVIAGVVAFSSRAPADQSATVLRDGIPDVPRNIAALE